MTKKPTGTRGPKATYEHEKRYQSGAPLLTTRIDPEALDWVKSRPEGTRPYLERIIGEDRGKVLAADSVTGAVKRSDTCTEAADT